MKYCNACKQKVQPQKKFSWLLFLGGALLFGVGAVVYLIYYFMFAPKKHCAICKGTDLVKFSPEEVMAKEQKKAENKEKRTETFNKVSEKVKETVSNKLE